MMRFGPWLKRLGALPLILALGACATLTPEAATPRPQVKTRVVVGSFEPIGASPADSCETQKAIARHNARYDSIAKGKAVKYLAPCETDGKAGGKTS